MLDCRLSDLPLAIVDIETTGRNPARHDIIEVAILTGTLSAGLVPTFESVVRPRRAVRNRHVHGIPNRHLQFAPRFDDLAKGMASQLEGRLFVAHNAKFDLRFLMRSFSDIGVGFDPPYLCTMQLARALLPSSDQTLQGSIAAYSRHLEVEMPTQDLHTALGDAGAVAWLLKAQFDTAVGAGVVTLREMMDLSGELAFFKTLSHSTAVEGVSEGPATGQLPVRRTQLLGVAQETARSGFPERRYLALLSEVVALEDLQVTASLLQASERCSTAGLRWAHAVVFSTCLAQVGKLGSLSEKETEQLSYVHNFLRQLGWAPGDTNEKGIVSARNRPA